MKKVIIALVIGLVLVGGIMFAMKGKKQTVQTPTSKQKPKLTLPANDIPVSERPFVMIEPTTAREVLLTIGALPKSADSVDFELQYSAGEKEEAAIGSLDLSKKAFPYSKKILLGSQSGGGKITYHENVTGGTLVLSFYDQNYKLSNEWAYLDNKKPQAIFGSRDGKFSLDTGKLLKGMPYVVIYNNPGLPKTVEKPILAGPYSISGTSALPEGKAILTVRLSEDKPTNILGWNGKEWETFPAKVAEKTATAQVDLAQTYVAVEK